LLVLPNGDTFYDSIALRVTELGLGLQLKSEDASPEKLRNLAEFIIADAGIKSRVREAQSGMIKNNDPSVAVQLIERICQVTPGNT
jgi:UDP:flavonoid glycosyltransferase YjiC (YdhE family)